jgi:hypothetical protein
MLPYEIFDGRNLVSIDDYLAKGCALDILLSQLTACRRDAAEKYTCTVTIASSSVDPETPPMGRLGRIDEAGNPMDAFYEHHQDSIRFRYRCFDRILLNGLIQPFQQPERAIGFFRVTYF